MSDTPVIHISKVPVKGYVPCIPNVGDSIRIVRPDPDSGCSCIVGQYDCAWEVIAVRPDPHGHLIITILTDWVPMFADKIDLVQCESMDWIEIVDTVPYRPR
jgi:hypothetical protein